MTNTNEIAAFEQVLISGDLNALTPEQRITYYNKTCESLKLNPLTKPFEYIRLNGKLTLYAKRDCTDQLRKIHQVSIKIIDRQKIEDIYIVVAEACLPAGRLDAAIGAVSIAGLKGDAMANAIMKAETKAKRRVTLSICGLGLLDETEAASIPGASEEPMSNFPTKEDSKPKALFNAPVASPSQISVKQAKRLFAIAKSAHWSDEKLRNYLKENYGVIHSSEIPWVAYDNICNYIASNPNMPNLEQPPLDETFPFEEEGA